MQRSCALPTHLPRSPPCTLYLSWLCSCWPSLLQLPHITIPSGGDKPDLPAALTHLTTTATSDSVALSVMLSASSCPSSSAKSYHLSPTPPPTPKLSLSQAPGMAPALTFFQPALADSSSSPTYPSGPGRGSVLHFLRTCFPSPRLVSLRLLPQRSTPGWVLAPLLDLPLVGTAASVRKLYLTRFSLPLTLP